MKGNLRIIAGLLLAAVGLSGCGLVQRNEAVELKGEPVYLGVATSLSGGSAMLGEATKRGAEIAVAEFNAAGGYQGRSSWSATTTRRTQTVRWKWSRN